MKKQSLEEKIRIARNSGADELVIASLIFPFALIFLAMLLTGCASMRNKAKVAVPKELNVVEKIERCVHHRINEGVKPLAALEICDTIYRGRK